MSKKTYVFFKDIHGVWHRQAYVEPYVRNGKTFYASVCGKTIEAVETENVIHEAYENEDIYSLSSKSASKPSNGEYCEECDIISDPWPQM